MEPLDIPPKLPETTNLVSINSKNDHSEINAMNTRTRLENRIPPLKNLDEVQYVNCRQVEFESTHALPRNSTPVPTKAFNNCRSSLSICKDTTTI